MRDYMSNYRQKQKENNQKALNEITLRLGKSAEIFDRNSLENSLHQALTILNEIIDQVVSNQDRKIIREESLKRKNSIDRFVYQLESLKQILFSNFKITQQ
jgi:hypothetical protein